MNKILKFNSFILNENNINEITIDSIKRYESKVRAVIEEPKLVQGLNFVIEHLDEYQTDEFVKKLSDRYLVELNNHLKTNTKFWKKIKNRFDTIYLHITVKM